MKVNEAAEVIDDRSRDYVRFMVLGDARTGTSMMVQALNSNPSVVCFREVFHKRLGSIDYNVRGYDRFDAGDIALRNDDPVAFMQERIFGPQPASIRAVGFKLLHTHTFGFPGLLNRIAGDPGLRVLHLKRRNSLRQLVSTKIAQKTGVWLESGGAPLSRVRLLRATRHPLRTVRRRLRRRKRPPRKKTPFIQVTVTAEELYEFMVRMEMVRTHVEELFSEHDVLAVDYEDLLDHRDEVFERAQRFLGVEPRPLSVTLRRQNPEPLRKLIANYDELYEAYKDNPDVDFFDR